MFLASIYARSLEAFKEAVLNLQDHCSTLHYDFIETIGKFLIGSCNFGGVEGAKLITESSLASLEVALLMLKVVERVPEGAEFVGEEQFVDWYLNNNDYELTISNPANRSPSFTLIKQVSALVLEILQASTPSTVLNRYIAALNHIKVSKKMSLSCKHLAFNKLHYGATQLLKSTLTPGSLAEVLVLAAQPLLITLISELKASLVKRSREPSKRWENVKEVDITDRFSFSNCGSSKSDLQAGKGGTKSTITKLPITQKHIRIEIEESHSVTKFVVGFAMNDAADNKTAILPTRVELFGGSGQAIHKVGQLKMIEDQFFLSYGVRLFAINFNAHGLNTLNSIKALELRLY